MEASCAVTAFRKVQEVIFTLNTTWWKGAPDLLAKSREPPIKQPRNPQPNPTYTFEEPYKNTLTLNPKPLNP